MKNQKVDLGYLKNVQYMCIVGWQQQSCQYNY